MDFQGARICHERSFNRTQFMLISFLFFLSWCLRQVVAKTPERIQDDITNVYEALKHVKRIASDLYTNVSGEHFVWCQRCVRVSMMSVFRNAFCHSFCALATKLRVQVFLNGISNRQGSIASFPHMSLMSNWASLFLPNVNCKAQLLLVVCYELWHPNNFSWSDALN